MPGLHLFTSNRLEKLVDLLAENLRKHPLPPLSEEVVLVQNKGMQRWINLEIANRNGICANMSYPFPRTFVYEQMRTLFDLTTDSLFDKETMTWFIMKEIGSLINLPEFQSVNAYVSDDDSGLKTFQISEKIAELFDQYLISRPEMITEWDRGENNLAGDIPDSSWQQILWTRISQDIMEQGGNSSIHHARLRDMFLSEFQVNRQQVVVNLPERISVFGISTLSPFYIDVLSKLSEMMEVSIYYLNPCREYWEYAFNEKELIRFSKEGVTLEDQYYDQGNNLLASMGTAGREFFSLILNRFDDHGTDLFTDPGNHNLLSSVQSDILNLVNREKESVIPISDQDHSIQIHSCHSPSREIDVLYDVLLSLFDENPDLMPRDIVVMMPDVTPYAPLIQAVFDNPYDDSTRIPYSISDTVLSSVSSVSGTFLKLLKLGQNRYYASDVLDILEAEPVRQSFQISSEDLELIKKWVAETGICWGIDGSYKEKFDLPAFHANSWRFGLERMLLGHALPPGDSSMVFSGISPYGEIEGDHVRILGSFTNFIETLFSSVESLSHEKTLNDWAISLNTILIDFFHSTPDTEAEITEIRAILTDNGLSSLQEKTGFDQPVSFEIISDFLLKRIRHSNSGRGFISTGVTFCTLLPMRSIPFKVVYLLGLNDGEFPRTHIRPGFDLMEKKKKICDWSKRLEDRYLFLESLLSARENLIISYNGQSLKDNSTEPPSVLVSELTDYLDQAFILENGASLTEHVLVKHPLQPFSLNYFKEDSKLFSYSPENCRASETLLNKNMKEKPFIEQQMPDTFSETDPGTAIHVPLRKLAAFFYNTSEYLMRDRLNILLASPEQTRQKTHEPFDLDALESYIIKSDLLSGISDSQKLDQVLKSTLASGRLPHGKIGESELRMLEREILEFAHISAPYLVGGKNESHDVEIVLNRDFNVSVQGKLVDLYPAGQLFYRCAKLKTKDLLKGWIHHIILNSNAGFGPVRETRVLGTDRQIGFQRLDSEQAREILSDLILCVRQGSQFPLPFLPESSFAYAKEILTGTGTEQDALNAAEKKWFSGFYYTGEQENVYHQACFGNEFPGSEEFKKTALMVYSPLIENMRDI